MCILFFLFFFVKLKCYSVYNLKLYIRMVVGSMLLFVTFSHPLKSHTKSLILRNTNALVERHHCHVVETGFTLLHQSSVPTSFWPHAFQTAIYLVNHLPSATLSFQTPFYTLFQKSPSYLSLRQFGCLCYSWLLPYTHSKLEPRSRPCVFLSYDLTHHAYSCFNSPINSSYPVMLLC